MKLISNPLKILVIGGCHTVGYPMGKEFGFPLQLSVLLYEKNIDHELAIEPYLTLNKPGRLREALTKHKPDILLLQCGHYEFIVESFIRRLLKKKQSRSSDNKTPSLERKNTSQAAFRPDPRYQLLQLIKQIGNLLVGYSLLNKTFWKEKTNQFFSVIKEENINSVFILEPFHTQNKITNRYRSIGAGILKRTADHFGYSYLNGINQRIRQKLGKNFTIDEAHLNVEAHSIVADTISRKLLQQVNRKPAIQRIFPVTAKEHCA